MEKYTNILRRTPKGREVLITLGMEDNRLVYWWAIYNGREIARGTKASEEEILKQLYAQAIAEMCDGAIDELYPKKKEEVK